MANRLGPMTPRIDLASTKIKRALAIALLLLLSGLLLGLITSAATSFPVAAEIELESFLSSWGQGTTRIEELVRASRPWNLGPELGLTTAGDSLYFATDLIYDPRPDRSAPVEAGVPTSAIRSGFGKEGTPLPYPPQEVWCVLVHSEAGQQVILLGRHHRDPYQTDWIIHQQPADPSPAGWIELLDLLGCGRVLQDAR
jgi:hypothetical protein